MLGPDQPVSSSLEVTKLSDARRIASTGLLIHSHESARIDLPVSVAVSKPNQATNVERDARIQPLSDNRNCVHLYARRLDLCAE